jgi:tRNA U34 5-methylaminomethyl-2-thiouridine-forming methyltransferase MnmC
MREVKLIQTEDGSSSLFLPELNETYHSFHGALGESQHVFIHMGLEHWRREHPEAKGLRIFEVGFGTGLNALLALAFAETYGLKVRYTTLEPFPLSEETAAQLNYGSLVAEGRFEQDFQALHAASWEEGVSIRDSFLLKKEKTKLEDFAVEREAFDAVFFDAFAPSKQAELWEKELLEKVADLMAPSAVFTTYCAKGQLKRDLKAIGLQVETLPGAPGKKEMVRATKAGSSAAR